MTGGDMRVAINVAVTTLIITCPCALGLAVPAVVTAASGKLFRKGLADKGRHRAGTAGRGGHGRVRQDRHADHGHACAHQSGRAPDDARRVALALAEASSHPWRCRLAKGLRVMGVRPAPVSDLTEVPGYGVEGQWHGARVRLGRPAWVGAEAVETTAAYLSLGGTHPRLYLHRPVAPRAPRMSCAPCTIRASRSG